MISKIVAILGLVLLCLPLLLSAYLIEFRGMLVLIIFIIIEVVYKGVQVRDNQRIVDFELTEIEDK
ncbi:hypothetical protein [Streptococcus loxodontisalivarius]|uniref:4-hydroxybenzoate polyprenyltransferase n=1 Tax=Streptococcus loxodontisalivarius TaxID=1349415 RepID=A0ABS2PV37_9STRE|nr:hypothetical protein [Streptococcus loxodontisalivarius]MBM7643746.1 4-hydroxybenzoate polyprenyltransferase [Streptococcus loxodontisalivarius]